MLIDLLHKLSVHLAQTRPQCNADMPNSSYIFYTNAFVKGSHVCDSTICGYDMVTLMGNIVKTYIDDRSSSVICKVHWLHDVYLGFTPAFYLKTNTILHRSKLLTFKTPVSVLI